MPREGELAPGREDPNPGRAVRPRRRQQKGGLRTIHLARDRLHLPSARPFASNTTANGFPPNTLSFAISPSGASVTGPSAASTSLTDQAGLHGTPPRSDEGGRRRVAKLGAGIPGRVHHAGRAAGGRKREAVGMLCEGGRASPYAARRTYRCIWTPPARGYAIMSGLLLQGAARSMPSVGPSSDCSRISGLFGERVRSGP